MNFERRYGFRSDALRSLEYFDEPTIAALAQELNIQWTVHRPWYGWKWGLRPWKARLLGTPSAVALLDSGREFWRAMIIFLHPRATRPKNRRFPLADSVDRRGAGRQRRIRHCGWQCRSRSPDRTLDRIMRETGVEMLAVSVMPGPQMAAAIPLCRDFRQKYPTVPDRLGRVFPIALRRCDAECALRGFRRSGQGEDTFLELLAALRGPRKFGDIRGFLIKTISACMCTMPSGPCVRPTIFPGCPIIALSQSGEIYPADVSGTPHGRPSRQHWLSVSLQVLRSGSDLSMAGRKWRAPSAPPPSSRICSASTTSTPCSSTTIISSCNESHAREQAELLDSPRTALVGRRPH